MVIGLLVREFNVRDLFKQSPKEYFEFETCQWRTETKMRACAEREMPVWMPADVESVGIG